MPKGNRSGNRGRPPTKADVDKHRSRRITLPPQIDAAIEAARQDGEAYSQALVRMLTKHISGQQARQTKQSSATLGAERRMIMEKIVIAQFGEVTRFAAAEIVNENGSIGAWVAEPESRGNDGWDEATFRAAVIAEVEGWEPRDTQETLYIEFDPGRDNAEQVEVRPQG